MTFRLVPLDPPSSLQLSSDEIRTVDLLTGFSDDDYISIALPAFPASSLDLNNTTVEFTSNPTANFHVGPTASVAFSLSETPLVDGNSEVRFQRYLLGGAIDLSSITGVAFQISATNNCSFRCLSIRLLSRDWSYASVDLDTLDHKIVSTKPLNGSLSYTPSGAFPKAFPDSWPTVWRSDSPPSVADPRPVDSELLLKFDTGTAVAGESEVSIFFREMALDYTTQLDLDGSFDQEALDGQPQPDFTTTSFASRTQADVQLVQGALDGLSQFSLERKPDLLNSAYMQARLTWNNAGATLDLLDSVSVSPIYSFPVTLNEKADYVLQSTVDEYSGRVKIIEVLGNEPGDTVFDSTLVVDPALFKRRKGRVGWFANFAVGDAYIEHLHNGKLSFAEYRSQPLSSRTPVRGAQLQVGATGDRDLFVGINPGPWGGQFTSYPERGPEAFKVRNVESSSLQGIQSNPMYLDDLNNIEISFDLFVTGLALQKGIMHVFLWDGLGATELPAHHLKPDTWNSFSVSLSQVDILPGTYNLVIAQTIVGIPNDWAVDAIHVRKRSILWEGRSHADDAWALHERDWVPFRDALNPNNGIVFRDRSPQFQVRAKALIQSAQIGQIRIVPQYAEQGRLTWRDEAQFTPLWLRPTASFATATVGMTVTFTSLSTVPRGRLISSSWTFGDGSTGEGSSIAHTFEAGTYPVTLTVTSDTGDQVSQTQSVTV